MKNNIPNILRTAISRIALMFMGLLAGFAVQADIIDISVGSGGTYLSGGGQTVVFDVSFSSNTAESANYIEFSLVMANPDISLDHGLPSPSPFTVCGGNSGDEMIGTGPRWGAPPAMGSGCAAFDPDMSHQFGVFIFTAATVVDPIDILVTIVGDGFGEAGPSTETFTVTLNPVFCSITCPADITVNADAGLCGANVNIPIPSTTGTCNPAPVDQSGFFPVGVNEVVFTSSDDQGNDVSCTVFVTVLDNENPVINGCSNINASLASGECELTISSSISASDNCQEFDVILNQNNEPGVITTSVSCPAGPAHYYRVYDTDDYDIDTELNIDNVEFGVFSSDGMTSVTANIYSLNGSFMTSNLELLATNTMVLPVLNGENFAIPVFATIPAGEEFVVEIITPGFLFSGFVMGFNAAGESAPTYYSSVVCGEPEPITMDALGFAGFSAVLGVSGTESGSILNQVDNTGFEFGGEFPAGVYNLEFEAVDALGNTDQCALTVTINEFSNPIGAITCNDGVQVSLDGDCMAIVTADQILEGEDYGCYDDYIVQIFDENNVNYGNVLTSANIGQTLTAQVTGPNNNSCWGVIYLEDKSSAELDCQTIYTTCRGDLTPGSPIADLVTVLADIPNPDIDADVPSTQDFIVPVEGLVGSTIVDLDVIIDIDHTFITDLTVFLTAPDGTTEVLFLGVGAGCPGEGMDIVLDDEAMNSHQTLLDTCSLLPVLTGAYQPLNSLSSFDGMDPNGDWIITVADLAPLDGGTINDLKLVFRQTGGVVAFPGTGTITFEEIGEQVYLVEGLDPCGPAVVTYSDDIVPQECNNEFDAIIYRTFFVEDAAGNQSIPCVQEIFVFRNDLSTLRFPMNRDDLQLPSLSCEQYGNQIPGPGITGAPYGEFCDNIQVFPYEDTKLEICDNSYKLLRKWTVLEWCTGEVVTHNQIIKVLDKKGPSVNCPEDITISAQDFECVGTYLAVPPQVFFDCSDSITFQLDYQIAHNDGPPPADGFYTDANTTVLGNGSVLVEGLPFGRTWFRWTAYDDCDNVTECYYTVTVADQIAPVAVCDEFTVVSLGADGTIKVGAQTFNDGSHDNCGIVDYKVRKMTDDCEEENLEFRDYVTFCCEEVNTSVMVAFRVTDAAGNSNTCMVEVTVNDKLPPYITCPPDITIDCQEDYTDLEITGEAEAIDNCEIETIRYVENVDIDQCGRGLVRRTWTAIDKQGLRHSCVQRIWLVDDDPFEVTDITWPLDYEATTCFADLSPENLPDPHSRPIISDDVCSLTAATYKDQIFSFVDGVCEKILRTWTVIDWCTYDPDNPSAGGYYTYLQVIKLVNNNAPVIYGCDDVTLCAYNQSCSGIVDVKIYAMDDCTPDEDLVYSYEIDLHDDGIPNPSFSGSGSDASGLYVYGDHRIFWRVEDKCGNVSTCNYLFTVQDCKKPTPYCISSITTVVMPSSGSVQIWASDFDYGSYDNCTFQHDLKFSFSSNTDDTHLTLTCDDIPSGSSDTLTLEIWVSDDINNQDFCTVSLVIQDNEGDICPEADGLRVQGRIATETEASIDKVTVRLDDNISANDLVTETNNGHYSFSNLPENRTYTLTAERNDNPINGVSTLDLAMMQRHILGLEIFDTPYKVIASDVDNNSKISGADIVYLRKLILGIENEFPNDQKSWRFVDKEFVMNDITDPFPYDEAVDIHKGDGKVIFQNMVGVKIGDVSGNANPSLDGNIESQSRYETSLNLIVEQNDVQNGEEVHIPVYASQFRDMLGYQFTLEFDVGKIEYVGYESGLLSLNDNNFGMHRVGAGMITTSWNEVTGINVSDEEPLFTLVFRAREDTQLANVLDLNSAITVAEAYDINGETYGVNLLFTSDDDTETTDFELMQNRPNPFIESTTIGWKMPEDSEVVLTFYDVNGKVLKVIDGKYNAGYNTVEIRNSELNTTGVLYYTIKTNRHSATKKMISIK